MRAPSLHDWPVSPELHRNVVERLVADAGPIRRLWPVRARFALWLALGIGVAVLALATVRRPDLGERLHEVAYLLDLAALLGAALVLALLALRAAVPGREAHPGEVLAASVLLVGLPLLVLAHAAQSGPAAPALAGTGLRCAAHGTALALLPWGALLLALGRGVTTRAAVAGGQAGAAALLLGQCVLRATCPVDERIHLLTWHLAPTILGCAVSAWVGSAFLRRPNDLVRERGGGAVPERGGGAAR